MDAASSARGLKSTLARHGWSFFYTRSLSIEYLMVVQIPPKTIDDLFVHKSQNNRPATSS